MTFRGLVGRNKKFNEHPFPYHHVLEVEIHTLTNLGVGLGRVPLAGDQLSAASAQPDNSHPQPPELENQNAKTQNPTPGWVVMVPFTLPGEKVRARVFRNHKNYSEADLLEVLTPSPHRVANPPCPLFGTCGGCQYQHLTYTEQLTWKRQQVEELLKYMAGIEFVVNPVIRSPREFGYRSKITPHFHVGRTPPEETPIGFLKQSSRFDIVDVPHCPIATPEINAKLPEVRARTRRRLAAGEYKRDATLLLRHAQEGVVTDYDAIIHEVVPQLGERSGQLSAISRQPEPSSPSAQTQPAGAPPLPHSELRTPHSLRLHFLSRDFFQNNPFILPQFTAYARDQAAATGARFLVDAYCGSGLFALSCAPAFEQVAGIEISESSVKFATENAAANGITNATFRAGDAAQIFAGLEFPPADTAVLIDPPRRGCDESFLHQLFAFGPRGVIYVSCDPATQMRDLKLFLTAGYRLTGAQPFDLFPQTRHLECVITLVRNPL